MKDLVNSIGSSLIYTIPTLIVLFLICKGIVYFVNNGRKKDNKPLIGQGEKFVNIYAGTILVVGLVWIIATKLF